jgi:flavorubredoxin
METRVAEIAPGIFRLSTFVPEVAPPAGFTFNQFLILADEPLLFHCGARAMFPSISAAVATLMPLERLRWISFSHVEADESGAMNLWLAAAPNAEVAHGATACNVSIGDLADRPPRVLADGEVLDLGGRRVRYLDTPHVPHGWDAGMMFEEETKTLLCSDLFTHLGDPEPLTEGDILGPATAAEEAFQATSLTPAIRPTLARLADLKPQTLAIMHGSSYTGDCAAALTALGDFYAARLEASLGA